MTEGPATEMCYEGMEQNCSPISDASRLAGKSFLKQNSPEGDLSLLAVCPFIRSKRGAARLHPSNLLNWIHLCSQGPLPRCAISGSGHDSAVTIQYENLVTELANLVLQNIST